MTTHALLSPSSAHRWLVCAPAPRFEERLGLQDSSSVFAEEGTFIHALAAHYLRAHFGAPQEPGHEDEHAIPESGRFRNAETVKAARDYADRCIATDAPGSVIFVEERMHFDDIVPEGSGTVDFGSVDAAGVLRIRDLKGGKGVKVYAAGNSQLRLYAYGALRQTRGLYDVLSVELTIDQPRLDHVDTETLTVAELTDWAQNYVAPRAALAHAKADDLRAQLHRDDDLRTFERAGDDAGEAFAGGRLDPHMDHDADHHGGDLAVLVQDQFIDIAELLVGFVVDIADVLLNAFLFFVHALDALNQKA